MNYNLEEYFNKMRSNIIIEQNLIKRLIKTMLQTANCTNNQKLDNAKIFINNCLETEQKDGGFALFLKLNQQLQKWLELELSLLKEMNKITDNENTQQPIDVNLKEEDLSILYNFFNQNYKT